MPDTVPLFTMVVMAEPEHIVWVAGVAVAFGVGLTVIVKVFGVPIHTGFPVNATSANPVWLASPQLLEITNRIKAAETPAKLNISGPALFPVT